MEVINIISKNQDLFGRKSIYTDYDVTIDNAIQVLSDSIQTHYYNSSQILYLYEYYKGKQTILERTKTYNNDICNKIVINRANEIVSFKDGYLIGEPIQYISRGDDADKNDEINILNSYMETANKEAEDMDLVNWLHIGGIGHRLVLPSDDVEMPFEIHTLDPRNTFVVKKNNVSKTPQMGVTYVTKQDGTVTYSCWLKNVSFKIDASMPFSINTAIMYDVQYYKSPRIPLVEFDANKERMGAFEIVIGLLDAINLTESNRLDGVEQFIQAILVIIGADPNSIDFAQIKELGGLGLPADSNGGKIDVKYLAQELNQQQTQVLIDNMYDEVLTICGMPNRNGGSSTSDTGTAVIMRDGWNTAEGRAKITELYFKKSDREVLKLVLNLLKVNAKLKLSLRDIETKFTRHNYENLTVKVNALVAMLNNEKIHPLDAYTMSNLFIDSEAAYSRGWKHYLENGISIMDKLIETERTSGNLIE